jgi:hypothetical protein
VSITADWVANQRSEGAERLGEALVATYDRTFAMRTQRVDRGVKLSLDFT